MNQVLCGMATDEYGNYCAVMAPTPVACKCGRTTAFLVNRGGKTRCTECDRSLCEEGKGGV